MKPLLAACLSLLTLAGAVQAEWTPPEKPDPTTILREAQADARARRYEDALAKHLWYHENAEKFDPGQLGVRRSFALSDWYNLGADYAPALAKFEEVREAARKMVLEAKHPKHVRNAFADYAAMSKKLGEEEKVAELFLELRDKNEKHAKEVYRLADGSLIDADRFDVCGEFLDAEREMELQILGYEHNMKIAEERFGKQHRRFGEQRFRAEAAKIVFILVKNDRADEAKELAQQARDAWDDEKLNKALDEALAGKKPKAYP
ncbi:hypothetical protein [Lacipirellula sp.]|uniref:hypothetical protein n=1 Tax=Lacipirellula sp. TaxID=2691419 RepID=UPI003D0F78E4